MDIHYRGVQWEGGAVDWGSISYRQVVYNTKQITTPCFHCTTLCRM